MEIKIMKYKSLYIDGVDVLEGKKAIDCRYYGGGVYEYKTEDDYWHFIVDGDDILDGTKAINWGHYDVDKYQPFKSGEYLHLFVDGGVDILKGKKVISGYYKGEIFKYITEDCERGEINPYKLTKKGSLQHGI
jgi:hypothetical protein